MRLTYTILYVNDVKKSIEFYQKAFGLQHRFTHESGDYAEMETGAVTLAFCSHSLANQILKRPYINASQKNLIGAQISFEPANLKLAYETALMNNAQSLVPPEVKPWGWESAILLDPDGHIVELAKEISVEK